MHVALDDHVDSRPGVWTMKTLRELQERWCVAHEAMLTVLYSLDRRYGKAAYAPLGKRAKLEAAYKREDKASDAIFAWLDARSPRDWRHGVPAYWVCTQLTEADALTAGQLSVVPPPAYGHYESDAVRFAMPVETACV